MSIPKLARPLRGIVPPLVTPLCDDELDLVGLNGLIDHVIDGGAKGVFVLGTTGEGPHLCYRIRRQMIEVTCDHVAGRVPVFVGITDTIMEQSLEIAACAYGSGATAVVAAPPYYLSVGQSEISAYFEHLADSIRLPLFLYNMPSCTKVSIELETLSRLAQHSNIIGFKDSSGDLDYLRQAVSRLASDPGFTIMIGPEEILPEAMSIGAHGGVNGGANMFPSLYTSLHKAIENHDAEAIAKLKNIVIEISDTIYSVGSDPSRHICGTKSALRALGICNDDVAWPLRNFNETQSATISDHVKKLLAHPQLKDTRVSLRNADVE